MKIYKTGIPFGDIIEFWQYNGHLALKSVNSKNKKELIFSVIHIPNWKTNTSKEIAVIECRQTKTGEFNVFTIYRNTAEYKTQHTKKALI
jgi:hypothetical protein